MTHRIRVDGRTTLVRWCAILLAVLAASLPSIALSAGGGSADRDWDFVRQVLLTSEYGHVNARISRWNRSPRYRLFVRSDAHRDAALNVMTEINSALRHANRRISIEEQDRDATDGVIAIVPAESFRRMLKAAQCSMPPDDNAGIACVKVSPETSVIGDVLVLVDEELDQGLFRSALLEEVFQSLGVTNDHAIIEESLIFESEQSTTTWSGLAPIDKKALIFLYKYLEPGDDEATVRRKFDAHWHEIAVD